MALDMNAILRIYIAFTRVALAFNQRNATLSSYLVQNVQDFESWGVMATEVVTAPHPPCVGRHIPQLRQLLSWFSFIRVCHPTLSGKMPLLNLNLNLNRSDCFYIVVFLESMVSLTDFLNKT